MTETNAFRRFLHAMAAELEGDIDLLHRTLAGDTRGEKLRMLAYAGYRNATELRVKGRMVRFTQPLTSGAGTWSKVRAMLAIYNSHEVAGVPVRCGAFGATADTISDDEGYFGFSIAIDRPLPPTTKWEAVTLATPGRTMQAPSVEVPVLAPGTDDRWGIISDIDDTVIETGATDFFRNWRRVLAQHPNERIAVAGAASLYGTIARNHTAPTRPFFYVSSSPWNLYGFITEFMELNRIPHGPMFLKDLGLDATKFIDAGHEAHKLEAIRTILAFYAGHKFLLMGDNGQKDVEIYAEAVKSFSERVGAVFIRDVTGTCASGPKFELLQEMAAAGVLTYCASDFGAAVAVLDALGIERPVEAAQAAGQDGAAASEP